MSYHIAILANQPECAQLFVDAFPKGDFPDLTIHVFFDDRHFDHSNLPSIVESFKPLKIDCQFYLGSSVINDVRDRFGFSAGGKAREILNEMPLILKFIIPIYLHMNDVDKILYCDDDTVICRDPRPLIDKYDNAAMVNGMDKLQEKIGELYVPAFNRIVGGVTTLEEYNHRNLLNSLFILTYSKAYESAVKKFLNEGLIHFLWDTVPHNKRHNKIFFWDMVFLNFYLRSLGKEGEGYGRIPRAEVRVPGFDIGRPEKRPKKFLKMPIAFTYYGNLDRKREWIDGFRSINVEDREFLAHYGEPTWLHPKYR